MKHIAKAAIIASAILTTGSGTALANDMFMDLGSNAYDSAPYLMDADSTTGIFTEFGFNTLLATSIYDMTDGSLFGAFSDTNIAANLTAAGVPTSGLAMDGTTPITLAMPNCAGGQCDIDGLSDLVPPLAGVDGEGFLLTWDLQVEYNLLGTLTPGGPVYTGGFIDIFFNDLIDDTNDRKVLGLSVTGSSINLANLDVFFDITFAEDNFLWIDNGSKFVDANDGVVSGDFATMVLDTNVNPPIPTTDQLLLVRTNAIRQSTLDGSLTGAIPTPGTIALFGLGLIGLGAAARRRTQS